MSERFCAGRHAARLAATVALSATCVSSWSWTAPALAETFLLQDGSKVEGSLVDATLNTLVIWRQQAGPLQTPRGSVTEVHVPSQKGGMIKGALIGWADGVYQIKTAEGAVMVRADGTLLQRSKPTRSAAATPAEPPALKPKAAKMARLGDKPPTFVLGEQNWVIGTIVAQTGQSVVLRLPLAGLRQIPLNAIRSVAVTLANGQEVEGQLKGWADGVYELAVGDQVIGVRDPALAGRSELAPPVEASASRATAAEVALPPAKPRQAEIAAAAEPAAGPAEAEDPGDEGVVASLPATAPAKPEPEIVTAAVTDLPVIEARLLPTWEHDRVIQVSFALSRPVDKPVLIAYGSVNGTAVAGVDYQQQRGVLTVQPGELQARLEIGLMNDQLPEGNEDFTMFFSTSPGVATLAEKRVLAVIEDDDS